MARRCADSECVTKLGTKQRRSDRFLTALRAASGVTFVSHVNPDPDSLAAMLGLAHLVDVKLRIPTRMTRDGLISRAENRAMVDTLRLNLIPIDQLVLQPGEAIVMVDSQPKTGRHSFQNMPITAVLDHHDTPGDLDDVPFTDIRSQLGATCTLVTRYLIEQEVEIPERVATALTYAIETEVSGYPREAGPMDDAMLQFLYPMANKELISRIRNARLPHSHFECMLQALTSSFIYDRMIVSWVNDLPQPEQAAEVVDFLVRFEKVDWAICAGVHGDKLIISVRTSLPNAQAGDMIRKVVGDLGKAGGHDRRAGGCILLQSTSQSAIEDLQAELRRRLLRVLDIDEVRGKRLVPLRDIRDNLPGL